MREGLPKTEIAREVRWDVFFNEAGTMTLGETNYTFSPTVSKETIKLLKSCLESSLGIFSEFLIPAVPEGNSRKMEVMRGSGTLDTLHQKFYMTINDNNEITALETIER